MDNVNDYWSRYTFSIFSWRWKIYLLIHTLMMETMFLSLPCFTWLHLKMVWYGMVWFDRHAANLVYRGHLPNYTRYACYSESLFMKTNKTEQPDFFSLSEYPMEAVSIKSVNVVAIILFLLLLEAVSMSGIASKLMILTNGSLQRQFCAHFWFLFLIWSSMISLLFFFFSFLLIWSSMCTVLISFLHFWLI